MCERLAKPVDEAAPLAVATCREHADALREIRFVLFGAEAYKRWRAAAADVPSPHYSRTPRFWDKRPRIAKLATVARALRE